MPSSNPLDPTNYLTVLPPEMPKWHGGFGTVSYSFLSVVPSYYPQFDDGSSNVGDLAVAAGAGVSLSSGQRELVGRAIDMFNDVANINLVETTGIGDITFGAYAFDDPGLFGFAYYPGTPGVSVAFDVVRF